MLSSAALRLGNDTAHVILALPPRFVSRKIFNDLTQFYDHLEQDLLENGVRVERQPVNKRPFERSGNRSNLIVIHNGARHLPNTLNTGHAYIPGFWNIDPKGVRGMSSIKDQSFASRFISGTASTRFCDDLRRKYVETRRSIYTQERKSTNLPVGSIAVFFQGDNSVTRRTMRPGSRQMLKAVAANDTNLPIVVKHHPLKTSPQDVQAIKDLIKAGSDIIQTNANVHDILRTCSVAVSVSSGACFEGFLHRKPAIFFGKTDLSQQAYLAHDAESFSIALEHALNERKDYDKFVYWYLTQQCVSASDQNIAKALLSRARDNGFDINTLFDS